MAKQFPLQDFLPTTSLPSRESPAAGMRNRALLELAAAREALRESNERIRRVLESITDGFAVLDAEGRFTYLNSKAADVFRRVRGRADDLVGMRVWDEFPELSHGRVGRALRRAQLERTTVEIEHFYAPLASWFEVRIYPSPDGLSIYFQDITRRRNAEDLVDFERSILELVVRGAPLPRLLERLAYEVAAHSVQGVACRVRLAGDAGAVATGGGVGAGEAVAAGDVGTSTSTPIVSSRGETLGEISMRYPDGAQPGGRDLEVFAAATRLAGIAIERARAEAALHASEELSRSIVQSSQDCIKTLTLLGHVVWISEQGRVALGLPEASAVTGRSWVEFWKDADRPAARKAVQDAAEGGVGNFVGAFEVNGTQQWWSVVISPMLAADGKPEKLLAVSRNVSERVRREQELREEARVLELLNRTGTALTSSLDLDAVVQTITDATTELSGAEFGAFFYNVVDDKGEAFQLYALSGASRGAFAGFAYPRATPLFAATFRGEAVIRLDDVTADPRYGQWEPHRGMPPGHLPVRSYLAVPVVSRSGEVIGGLFFGHSRTGVFTERAERIVTAVAAQAAVAIDNARLYQSAQRATAERDSLLASERAARGDAERANRIKDEFLATLSHELRTPLSSILGWSNILRSGRASQGDFAKGLDIIERNARAQAQLIEDLLDMSRIISGKLRLDIQQVEPAAFIQAALETVRPAAQAKDIRLESSLDGATCLIAGDPNRLQQVVWNLLSNAIKFTPAGGKVDVKLARTDGHVEIAVTDTGMGIDPRFLEHVFERFRQADSSATRPFGGLGLGLSIVKHLVELHGGAVRAWSKGANTGATFTVTLPVAALLRETMPERRKPRTGGALPPDFHPVDLAGVRVLLVDDQPDARELVARVLQECNADVEACASAATALAAVDRLRPHVILTDIGMPEMDGYELLRKVRANPDPALARTPAIALTAFARSEDRTRALRAGFLVHVAKPVEPSELVATVASAAGRFGR